MDGGTVSHMALRNRQSSSDPSPAESPAPWSTRCETYWMILWLRTPLPDDAYDPLEASHPAWSGTDFKGGLGMIQVVRYSGTPVGAYDELVIIPGTFQVPGGSQKGRARMRISRIYVSQRETTYNGRNNWNIPKHLARFDFSAPPVAKGSLPPNDLIVSVFPPGEADDSATPFFRATLTPLRHLPGFPLSTAWLPLNTTMVQPPIPAGDNNILCGTDIWRTFDVVASTKRARLMWVNVDEKNVAREGYWPDVKPWSLGVWLEHATLDITEPEEWQG